MFVETISLLRVLVTPRCILPTNISPVTPVNPASWEVKSTLLQPKTCFMSFRSLQCNGVDPIKLHSKLKTKPGKYQSYTIYTKLTVLFMDSVALNKSSGESNVM